MKLDNTIKNILSSKEAETEYEELLSQSGLLNNDELKHSFMHVNQPTNQSAGQPVNHPMISLTQAFLHSFH